MSKEPAFDTSAVNEHADYVASVIAKHTPALAVAARDLAKMVHVLSEQVRALSLLQPPPIVIVVESEEARARIMAEFRD